MSQKPPLQDIQEKQKFWSLNWDWWQHLLIMKDIRIMNVFTLISD